MTTTSLHTVETAQPDPEPLAAPATYLLTGAHAEAVMRLVTLTLEAAREAGDHIDVHVDTSQATARIEILVERR
jgi:hypothetical protein